MAFITYRFADGTREEIEVTEEFAAKYAEMEHKDALIERKETRRHQSLDKPWNTGLIFSIRKQTFRRKSRGGSFPKKYGKRYIN